VTGNGPSYEELLRENERLREELRAAAERDVEGEQAHRALVDYLGAVLITIDSSGRVELVSNAVNEERWGSPNRIRGTSALEHVHPEDRLNVARAIKEGLESGDTVMVVYRMTPPIGETRWIECTGRSFRASSGEMKLALVNRDITERLRMREELRRAEQELLEANRALEQRVGQRTQALRSSERRFQIIFDEVPVGIILWDANGGILEVNEACCRLLGYETDELLGLGWAALLDREGLARDGWLARALRSQRLREFEAEGRLKCKDDSTLPVFVSVIALEAAHGEVVNWISMIQDRTERQNAEDQLRRADRLSSVGTFAAGIAHEINNSLSVIRMAATMARDGLGSGGESVRRALQDIERRTSGAAAIVSKVLQFSRADRSDVMLIDLNELAAGAVEVTGVLSGKSGVALETWPAPRPVQVRGSAPELEQALVNVIMNAIQATSAGGKVDVRVRAVGERAEVAVFDTGEGIPAGDLPRIFDPFYTTRPPGQGTGLGLSVVHGIVHAHHGEIRVDSQPGTGTTFTIDLPKGDVG
jgi:PAS domain S-box-containing protein